MRAALASEVYRTWHRGATWWCVAAMCAAVFLSYLGLWALEVGREAALRLDRASPDLGRLELGPLMRLDHVPDVAYGVTAAVGTMIVMAFAVSAIGTELSWGTVRTIVPRIGSRDKFVLAKVLVASLIAVVGAIVAALAAFDASLALTVLRSLDPDVQPDVLARALVGPPAILLATAPYIALAVAATIWTRSTAAGLAIGGAVFLLEGFATALVGALARVPWLPAVGPARNVQAVMQLVASTQSPAVPELWVAVVILLAYTLVFASAAVYGFASRDIGPRS